MEWTLKKFILWGIFMYRKKFIWEWWCAEYRKDGVFGLTDRRKSNLEKPSENEIYIEEKWEQLMSQKSLLKPEYE